MAHDLPAIQKTCERLRLRSELKATSLDIVCSPSATLRIVNADEEDDCLVCIEGGRWHVHDSFTFADASGRYIEMSLEDVLEGLATGQVLVGETWRGGELWDLTLVHAEFNDELRHLDIGDEVRISRASTQP